MVSTTSDPMDTAMTAEGRTGARTFFGHILVDAWHCVLVKGQGKVPFDPAQHSEDNRCTALDFVITPIARPGNQSYRIERNMIAESKEWASVVKPSLKALGVDLRGLSGKYVQVQMIPFGGSYVNKQGETKDRSTLKFIAVYPDEDACKMAMGVFWSQHGQHEAEATSQPAPAAATTTANPAQKALAAKFLPGLWKASGGDLAKMEALIKSQPMVSKHFSMESQEVIDVCVPF